MAWPVLKFSFGWSANFEVICSDVFEVEDSIELGFISGSMACEFRCFIEIIECSGTIDGREIGEEDSL